MRFLKIILSVFALFYRLTPNYLIISDVYFLHRKVMGDRIRIIKVDVDKYGVTASQSLCGTLWLQTGKG